MVTLSHCQTIYPGESALTKSPHFRICISVSEPKTTSFFFLFLTCGSDSASIMLNIKVAVDLVGKATTRSARRFPGLEQEAGERCGL